jgi:hypothetical protein
VALISRRAFFAILFIAGILASGAVAPAAVDLSTGIRYVIPTGSIDECSSKVQTALNKYLQNASETAPGSHEFVATGPIGGFGDNAGSAAGTAHCYPLGKGYVATFTCAVETPNSPYDADSLCLDIAHNFKGTDQKPLPAPTPVTAPKGCNTQSLAGTWQSNDDPKLTFTMDPGGNIEASDGVSGNWALSGLTATITYYGNNTETLSSDGKHLSGKYNLTRKC